MVDIQKQIRCRALIASTYLLFAPVYAPQNPAVELRKNVIRLSNDVWQAGAGVQVLPSLIKIPTDKVALNATKLLAELLEKKRYPFHTYHNICHTIDVANLAAFFGDDDTIVAALFHDLGHPGGGNGRFKIKEFEPDIEEFMRPRHFFLEERSWQLAKPLLEQAGYEGERLERLHMAVLATDPIIGPKLRRLAMRYHQILRSDVEDEDGAADILYEVADILRRKSLFVSINRYPHSTQPDFPTVKQLADALFADAETARLADALGNADIGSSLISPQMYIKNTMRLHSEFEQHDIPGPLGKDGILRPAAVSFFLDEIAFAKESFFNEKVEALFREPIEQIRKKYGAEPEPIAAGPVGTNPSPQSPSL
jgi:hypothetical protein